MKRVLVTVTGPSGSGKTELVNLLTKQHNFGKLVSVTTRPMRPGEINGVDYYFINQDTFEYLEREDKLVQTVCFNGKNYGTTTDEVERVFAEGKVPIVIVEPSGVDQFKLLEKQLQIVVYSLFIEAPYELLKARFLKRQGDSELTEYDRKRLDAVKAESEEWYFQKAWTNVFHNNSNDLENLAWFASGLESDIELFKQEVSTDDSQG